jgi:hypothetical protein
MPINDTLQLSVSGFVTGQRHVHTLHFRLTDAGGSDLAVAQDYETNILPAYKGIFKTFDLPAQQIAVRQICGTVPLRAAAEVTPASSAGTRTSGNFTQAQPSWLASQWSVRTALGGRSRRGRNYFGGLDEWDTDGNNLVTNPADTANAYARVVAYRDALFARYGVGGTQQGSILLVVHSHKLSLVPNQQCQNSSTPVTGIIVRQAIASMKSRKPGSGS